MAAPVRAQAVPLFLDAPAPAYALSGALAPSAVDGNTISNTRTEQARKLEQVRIIDLGNRGPSPA